MRTAYLYLIAHKVRGEPAFDIATREIIDNEEVWIIPTSGHRAYPYAHWDLDDLADVSDYPHQRPADARDAMPDYCPDHYDFDEAPKGHGILTDLATLLGLVTERPTITRR